MHYQLIVFFDVATPGSGFLDDMPSSSMALSSAMASDLSNYSVDPFLYSTTGGDTTVAVLHLIIVKPMRTGYSATDYEMMTSA